MDSDFAKVMVAFIVIGIPMIGVMLWGITDSILKHRRKMLEMETKLTAERAAEPAAQAARLEERMRVLERIVTDRGLIVADEIDALVTRRN